MTDFIMYWLICWALTCIYGFLFDDAIKKMGLIGRAIYAIINLVIWPFDAFVAILVLVLPEYMIKYAREEAERDFEEWKKKNFSKKK